jgi:hypothetical protein
MRYVLLFGCILAFVAGPTNAKDPADDPGHPSRVECTGIVDTCMVYDCSGILQTCGDADCVPIWEVGCPVPLPSGMPTTDCYGNLICDLGGGWNWMIGTFRGGSPGYPDRSGERLILDTLVVSDACYLVEMCHWYDTEPYWDGGNFDVDDGSGWTVLAPIGGYPEDAISTSACCVGGQPGFSGSSGGWVTDCWDLSAYVGSTVMIAVKFGSDYSVTYSGWYIMPPVAGGEVVTPIDKTTWGKIKAMYE